MTDRKIEHLFTYDINLLSTKLDSQGVAYDPSPVVKSVHTYGKNVWVLTAACFHKFQWIGDLSGHDFDMLNYDELRYHELQYKLVYQGSVRIPNGTGWVDRGFTNTWVTNSYYNWTVMTRINNNTGVTGTVNAPTTMISNLTIADGKLWCVGSPPTDQGRTSSDLNRLYIYTGSSNTWASVEIPVKKQVTKCQVMNGNDGYVYVTNFNNFSVSRFNASTGAFDQTFRTNGYPMTLCTSPDRGVFSGSYAGMLTKINGLTGEVFNAHSTIDPAIQLVAQGEEYVWFLKIGNEGKLPEGDGNDDNNDGKVRICRLKRADNEVLILKDDVDFPEGVTVGTPLSIDVSKPFKYKQFNGTDWYEVNAIPHLFFVDDANKLFMLKLDKFIMVEHQLKIESYSMISTGPNDYMGEIAQGDS